MALYFLVVNGPIGYDKYRLTMEQAFIVLFVAGLAGLGLLDRLQGFVDRWRHSWKQPDPDQGQRSIGAWEGRLTLGRQGQCPGLRRASHLYAGKSMP